MKALVYIRHGRHSSLVYSGLQQKYDNVVLCHKRDDFEEELPDADMLFVCDGFANDVKKIRQGEHDTSQFVGICLIDFARIHHQNLGLNAYIKTPFSIDEIRKGYDAMRVPKHDFILVPRIYNGPERRKRSRERADNRRSAFARNEKRYKAKAYENHIEWVEVPNFAFLTQLKLLHNEFRSGSVEVGKVKLKELLAEYSYSEDFFQRIVGNAR